MTWGGGGAGEEHCMVRMLCVVRLVDRVLTDVLRDTVGVVVKIEDIIQSRLLWYSHVMHKDINSQISKVMEAETNGKRKKAQPRKTWEECLNGAKN